MYWTSVLIPTTFVFSFHRNTQAEEHSKALTSLHELGSLKQQQNAQRIHPHQFSLSLSLSLSLRVQTPLYTTRNSLFVGNKQTQKLVPVHTHTPHTHTTVSINQIWTRTRLMFYCFIEIMLAKSAPCMAETYMLRSVIEDSNSWNSICKIFIKMLDHKQLGLFANTHQYIPIDWMILS